MPFLRLFHSTKTDGAVTYVLRHVARARRFLILHFFLAEYVRRKSVVIVSF